MPAAGTSASNSSSPTSYAIWLMSQSPRIPDSSVVGHIMNRYPELVLGEAMEVIVRAASSIAAGVAITALPSGQPIAAERVPVDPSLGGLYRSHVVWRLPNPSGGSTIRDVIVETDLPPSQDDLLRELALWIREWCRESLPGGNCPDLSDVDWTFQSVSRGPNT